LYNGEVGLWCAMPVGPLHLGFTLPVFARFRARLEFLPLAIGSFIPDAELLLMWPVAGSMKAARGPMHSLLGALTVDLAFTLLFAYLVAPPLIAWFAAKLGDPSLRLFAGADASAGPSRFSASAFSALAGTVSHVLIDLFSHERNPLFWPWDAGQGLRLMPLGPAASSILMHAAAGILLAWVLWKHWRR
jgi:membrane-bound metal-dependent hydrolase YbcI (DUF457 family)